MEITKINNNGNTETVQMPTNSVSMRGNAQQEITTDTPKDPKEQLTNPMETVGRSQVNFKAQLSSETLNKIAHDVAEANLNGEEIQTLKKALVNLLKKYKCKNFDELRKKAFNEKEVLIDICNDLKTGINDINPNLNAQKIANTADILFI